MWLFMDSWCSDEFPTLIVELLAEVCKICTRIYCIQYYVIYILYIIHYILYITYYILYIIYYIFYIIYYISYIIYMFFQQIMSINAFWSIGIEGKHHTKMYEFSLDWQIFSVVLFTDFVPSIGICSN